jgi:VanZ family protein
MKRSASLWGPVLAWAGLIFFLSSIPDLHSGLEFDFYYRKAAHMMEYGLLAALLWRALSGSRPFAAAALFALTLGLSVAYAASDEWHQSFVPGRGPSAKDVGIDGLGALAACLFLKRRTPA